MQYNSTEEGHSIATALSGWKCILAAKKIKMKISHILTSSYSQSLHMHNMTEREAAAFYRDFTFDSLNHCKIPTQLDKM